MNQYQLKCGFTVTFLRPGLQGPFTLRIQVSANDFYGLGVRNPSKVILLTIRRRSPFLLPPRPTPEPLSLRREEGVGRRLSRTSVYRGVPRQDQEPTRQYTPGGTDGNNFVNH